MKLKIGLDIDGVVADSFPVFVEELNKHYGKTVTKLDNYDMTKVYNVPWDDISKFFDDNMEYLFNAPKPMKGAVEGIKSLLAQGHEIIYVTARNCGAEERVTLKWMKKNKIPYNKILFVGAASKTFAVREQRIDVFVEDFMGNALEIAAIGVPVLLLDAPYNQGKLPNGVIRCKDWSDILDNIRSLNVKTFHG